MSFQLFAEQHGLIINDLEQGRWVRVPTVDHPNKRNGSYIFDGDKGAVQNWAVHERPVSWFSDHREWVDTKEYQAKKEKAKRDKDIKNRAAASKAGWILKQCVKSSHPYLNKKGFPLEKGWVWNDLLVIPMRISGNLVGCQLIDQTGNKKFLSGQITKGATATFENKGADIVTEGYATALSVRRALKTIRIRYRIHVTFSASNLLEVTKTLPNCVVVADNDATGLTIAKQTQRPYWASDVEGFDFNDHELQFGAEESGRSLLKSFGWSRENTGV